MEQPPKLEVIPMLGNLAIDMKHMSITWDPVNKQEPYQMINTDGNILWLFSNGKLHSEYIVLNLSKLEQVFFNIANYIQQQQHKNIFEDVNLQYIVQMCCLSFILQEYGT